VIFARTQFYEDFVEDRDVVEFDELSCKGSGPPLTLAYYLKASEPNVIKRCTIPDALPGHPI
jgi:hypothetical protein